MSSNNVALSKKCIICLEWDNEYDGKRLRACEKRLRVAFNSAKRTLEGGAGGRYGPTCQTFFLAS